MSKHLYIYLYHGRVHPSEELDDWGFVGPLIGPLQYVHTTYGVTRIAFLQDNRSIRNALAFGISAEDSQDFDLTYEGDLVKFEGFHWADVVVNLWTQQEASKINHKWFKDTKLKALSLQAQFTKGLTAGENLQTGDSTPSTDEKAE